MSFNKSKIHTKTLKTLLHISITRASSQSIYCSVLKLQFKTLSDLSYVYWAVHHCES